MAMSSSSPSSVFAFTLFLFFLVCGAVVSDPGLSSGEQEALYRVLEAISPEVSWRSLFPDDLCFSAPHGVACDLFDEDNDGIGEAFHVTELSFGYVSDYSPNPPCTDRSTISPLLASFRNLRKLFFYRCFTGVQVSVPDFSGFVGGDLEEILFIENPSLVGSLGDKLKNLTSLKKLVVTGSNVSGEIPSGLGDLNSLEQLTLARNKFSGELNMNLSKLKSLKLLDLSQNGFEGVIPETIGALPELLKLDLSSNSFSGKIPENLRHLKNLEFLDLGYNKFTNSGIPLFLSEMPKLKEVYLRGNTLGGKIPEIWENLGGILGIGLSQTGLVGEIPSSMAVFLRNICYIGLDNNGLEGTVPEEFGTLQTVNEMNLENNRLKGKIPFSPQFAAKMGHKLKLKGNPELCVDEGLRSAKISSSFGELQICKEEEDGEEEAPGPVLPFGGTSAIYSSHFLMFLGLLLLLT